jgi:hypothetical protein
MITRLEFLCQRSCGLGGRKASRETLAAAGVADALGEAEVTRSAANLAGV